MVTLETQLDRIRLQSNTYQRLRMTENTLDDAKLEVKCPLDNGRHDATSDLTLGLLEKLPSELVVDLLLSLDLQSLTAFRRVSRQAMKLVDSLHEYAQVVEHCPNILRAILSLNALSYDSRALFRALSSVKCAKCNQFGNYLYLITCKRVCYYCFTTDPDFLPMPAFQAGKHTGLSSAQLMSVAHVVTLPGNYAQGGKVCSSKRPIFDRQSAVDRAPSTPFDRRIEQPDTKRYESIRFMSIISAPYFDAVGTSCWGFYCTRCRDSGASFRIKYTKAGIVDHIKKHGPTKRANGP